MLPHIATCDFMWLYDWESFTVSHHAANFGGFRHCGRGDEKLSICHVISKDHVFQGLSDFIGRSPYAKGLVMEEYNVLNLSRDLAIPRD